MRRTPTRRLYDSRQPPEDILSPESTMEVLTPKAATDPAKRQHRLHYTCRIEDGYSPSSFQNPPTLEASNLGGMKSPPSSRSKSASGRASPSKGRALDNWRLGEGSRIMTYLQPKRYRPMSLYGEVFQGKWNTDWHDVSHISALREKYPWTRDSIQLKDLGPHPEGPSSQEIRRNRNFGPSHGAEKSVHGMIRCGCLCMIP
eukprot:symbB.v1.2.000693.t1/scaffold41.1/size391900/10